MEAEEEAAEGEVDGNFDRELNTCMADGPHRESLAVL